MMFVKRPLIILSIFMYTFYIVPCLSIHICMCVCVSVLFACIGYCLVIDAVRWWCYLLNGWSFSRFSFSSQLQNIEQNNFSSVFSHFFYFWYGNCFQSRFNFIVPSYLNCGARQMNMKYLFSIHLGSFNEWVSELSEQENFALLSYIASSHMPLSLIFHFFFFLFVSCANNKLFREKGS